MKDQLKKAAVAIKNADTIYISAGAGMGVDSGLPDFRGDEGFWKAYPLLRKEGLSFHDLANPEWFENDPSRAWGFYGHRFNLYREAKPHLGFNILQKWANEKGEKPFVFTTNVDGHFQKSGFSKDLVYERHGSINHLQCLNLNKNEVWETGDLHFDIDESLLIAKGDLPQCLDCSEVARPNILMFGDVNWVEKRSKKQSQYMKAWKNEYSEANVVTIEIGAGKVIPTARHASNYMSGPTVRINPRDSDGNENTISIALGALEALNKIDRLMNDI